MKALVIGFGSIGRRHAEVLAQLGVSVAVVSRRAVDGYRAYPAIENAISDWLPDYVVVASRTGDHFRDLLALGDTGFRGRILIEKPLFEVRHELPRHSFSHAAVAYNLRFHPLVQRLRRLLDGGGRLLTATVYVGQYLPGWRPQSDYRDSYSAHRAQGGGVLRDLSHELDYSHWLFGPWSRLSAIGGRYSDLEIDTEDAFSLLLSTPRCTAISVHMNYLDRVPRREITVNTTRHTVRVDLIKGTFEVDGRVEETVTIERNHTYCAEHRAMLSGDTELLCSLADGLDVVATIEAAEQAAASHTWIER